MSGHRRVGYARAIALLLCPLVAIVVRADAADLPVPERSPIEVQPIVSQKQPVPAPLLLKLEDGADTSRIAYDLARSFLSEEQWKARVAEMRRKFTDWEKDNEGDIGTYLNYQLPAIAFSASGGKIERLKDGAAFVALYFEFKQPVPQGVTAFARNNLASLNALFADFTWEKAADYVKNRQWQKDRESEAKKRTK